MSAGTVRLGPERRRAFETLFDREFSYVCRSLRRLGVVDADIEDLAQDVFLRAHDKFGSYDGERPARPWLFAFAQRVAANYRRLARHRECSDELRPHPVDPHTPEKHLERRQLQDLVLAALQHVAPPRRSVLIMADIDGFSAPEIAEAMSIPQGTVYTRVKKGREELRAAVQRIRRSGGGR